MNRPYALIGSVAFIVVLLIIGGYAYSRTHAPAPESATVTASYLCRDGKTIDASYATNSVTLTLSDTRALVLPQTVSGSGTRYEKGTAVFQNKGDNAVLTENGVETFADCVANGSPASADANGMRQFTDSGGTFSFTYPGTVAVSGGDGSYTQSWMTNATSSGIVLAKAVLSSSFQPKTNFVEATFTVGTSADPSAVSTCLTYNPSGGPAKTAGKATINGTTYTTFHSSDAGAGNRYETTSYRVLQNNQCYAIEYTVHSSAIENYSPDQGIHAFDSEAVAKVMDGLVQSFRFTNGA